MTANSTITKTEETMGCGAVKIHTVFAIGSIPEDLICSIADRERVRVLHRLTDDSTSQSAGLWMIVLD